MYDKMFQALDNKGADDGSKKWEKFEIGSPEIDEMQKKVRIELQTKIAALENKLEEMKANEDSIQ